MLFKDKIKIKQPPFQLIIDLTNDDFDINAINIFFREKIHIFNLIFLN